MTAFRLTWLLAFQGFYINLLVKTTWANSYAHTPVPLVTTQAKTSSEKLDATSTIREYVSSYDSRLIEAEHPLTESTVISPSRVIHESENMPSDPDANSIHTQEKGEYVNEGSLHLSCTCTPDTTGHLRLRDILLIPLRPIIRHLHPLRSCACCSKMGECVGTTCHAAILDRPHSSPPVRFLPSFRYVTMSYEM